jgi:hypothetical protein
MNIKTLIGAAALLGAALSTEFVKSRRSAAKQATSEERHYVVKYRATDDDEFTIVGAERGKPQAAYKTREDAVATARTITASSKVIEVKVIDMHTLDEIKF